MTETFKASNGWHIDGDGDLVGPTGILCTPSHRIGDAETFFTERRDHELGRWRDKEFPNLVCYSRGLNYVRVASERSGEYWGFTRDEIYGYSHSEEVARKYFKAHPAHKPLPTEDGLYVGSPVRDALAFARVYRLRDGEWRDLGRPESDPEVARIAAQGVHDDGGLVRLGIVESEDGE